MNAAFSTWKDIRTEVLRRIHTRLWAPGETIPNEVDLAQEFGCSRATVNRALRDLAEAGVVERRRKAGTRVALHPVARATLRIPIFRQEVEARGQTYSYALMTRENAPPPAVIRARMKLAGQPILHVESVHLADGVPLMFEDRWIDPAVCPDASSESFQTISANEWLLNRAPYTHGDIAFSSALATTVEAAVLGVLAGAALFVIERTTWDGDRAVTSVTQRFAPGYRMQTNI